MNLHNIILGCVAVLLVLAVLYALRFTATRFKGKKFGKLAKGLFVLIIEMLPKFISRVLPPPGE